MKLRIKPRRAVALGRSYEKFTSLFSGSGIMLMIATAIAVIWANSSYADSYHHLWHETHFTIGFDNFNLNKSLIHWINDALMAIFFFVVGLEIKRELVVGELNSVKRAVLPFFGALGGMLVPVLIFKLFGLQGEAGGGWGIAMATDIAFTIAVLALLGSKVPMSLKIFLTALAIIDDLGAVLVIAIFYTSTINWTFLLVSTLPMLFLYIMNRLNVQNVWPYTISGIIIWAMFLFSGIHATIAGVLVAFFIPVHPKVHFEHFVPRIRRQIKMFLKSNDPNTFILTEHQLDAIGNLQHLSRKVQSPLQAMEHDLSRTVTYIILPLFALANAGVSFHHTGGGDSSMFTALPIAIAVSLILGKCIGITFFSWLAVKIKLAHKPDGTNWMSFIGLGLLGGIGFTMSLFIATLAFQSEALIAQAKIGIFGGSIMAGALGFIVLKYTLKSKKR
ncbi:NhaA family Na+:H+ antiporter [Breznakibacter xylanolyticus]|uniref:Na(+)/H(+) antiporter NhaA n=1 Tax=Breznakibacter xylanolyticus TaxID=990 RepID=A0A2W7QEH1_9BACT|nr:Na+/H+ antiporter NhaA [Breznakibacter xylanolyticus]PZX20309.1 NhaA family Na+:H+ antiporter [Breznakibacter xylanolyticus]